MISTKNKFAWVGINGTATTSMAAFFIPLKDEETEGQPNQKHQVYAEIENELLSQNKNPSDFFKFTFVRNPWDRQVGRFYHDKMVGDIPEDVTFTQWIKWLDSRFERKGGFDNIFKDPLSFRPWCASLGFSKPKYLSRWDWPCFYWCCNSEGEICMDFIGRMENLKEDFLKLSIKMGINANLPHENKSERGPYQDYYTKETRDIVEKIFIKDIEEFNYSY